MTRGPILALSGLAAVNGLFWLLSFAAFSGHPALLGSALLAWVFGLRHAADADHLAAIDNVVRKLMQERKSPYLVGLFFSLGHSAVVVLACAAIAATASSGVIDPLHTLGGVVGTVISAGFLMIIAVVNLSVFLRLGRTGPTDETLDQMLATRGLLARILRPAIRLIQRPAHMFPLGFLFGLGFDTATEISLLAMSATQAASGLSFAQVLLFPGLFTAGMALIDTADSVLMVGAYGWALSDPARKLTYNRIVTGISVLLAFGIGGIEAAGLLSDQIGGNGWAWAWIDAANDSLGEIGYGVIALFLAAWGFAVVLHRRKAYMRAKA